MKEKEIYQTIRVLPKFEQNIFFNKRNKYALLIPVIDEGIKIINQLKNIEKFKFDCDLVIADGGSSDNSIENILQKKYSVRAVLIKKSKGKLGSQLRMGYSWCLDEGYEGIITVDGNGKDDVRAIPIFINKLNEGYDFVQGSRFLPGGKHQNTPYDRIFGNRIIHAPLISMAARVKFTDTTNGFRAYSRGFLLDSRVQPFRDIFNHYEILFYLSIRAGQIGKKICEIPVSRNYPLSKRIPTKISGLKNKFLILLQLLKAFFGYYAPKKD